MLTSLGFTVIQVINISGPLGDMVPSEGEERKNQGKEFEVELQEIDTDYIFLSKEMSYLL